MNTWRLAESLKKLREQINAEYPDRSKASDGSVGDLAHSQRKSDHNPNEEGVVCAVDVTHDPRAGLSGDKLAAGLIKSKDPRIKYIIWNRRMISSYPANGKPAWTWRPYTGANPHSKHLHISVSDEKKAYDSKREWQLDFDVAVAVSEDTADLAYNAPTGESESGLAFDTKPTPEQPDLQQSAPSGEPAKGSYLDEPIKIVKDNSGKLANWMVGAAASSTAAGFWQKNQTLIVVGLIILAVMVLAIYLVNRSMKLFEAKTAASRDLNTVEFVKKRDIAQPETSIGSRTYR